MIEYIYIFLQTLIKPWERVMQSVTLVTNASCNRFPWQLIIIVYNKRDKITTFVGFTIATIYSLSLGNKRYKFENIFEYICIYIENIYVY